MHPPSTFAASFLLLTHKDPLLDRLSPFPSAASTPLEMLFHKAEDSFSVLFPTISYTSQMCLSKENSDYRTPVPGDSDLLSPGNL